jgi:hypothetical protein
MADSHVFAFDRTALAEVLGAAMSSARPPAGVVPFDIPKSVVKTYVVEVNGTRTPGDAIERIGELAREFELLWAPTTDPALVLAWRDGMHLFVDTLDARFWLVHTGSPATTVNALLKKAMWSSKDLDRCWFSQAFLRKLQSRGQPRWFKSSFEGDRLLPADGVSARRLKVQLEGDAADELLGLLLDQERYRHATSLSAIATRLSDSALGTLDEFVTASGRFMAAGASFERHVGYVSQAVAEYRSMVENIEARYRFTWGGSEASGTAMHGETLTVAFGRPIPDLGLFLTGLFSCREPFRLWAVPNEVSAGCYEAEVVDLHVGAHMRMDITADGMLVYLPHDACGNTVLRLVTNLQHHFDATIEEEALQPSR